MLELIDEAIASGARLGPAAKVLGLSARTIIRWRKQQGGVDHRRGPHKPPPHRLSEAEREQILDTANSKAFRDLPSSRSCRGLRIGASTWPRSRVSTGS